jgi:hypothetical protein
MKLKAVLVLQLLLVLALLVSESSREPKSLSDESLLCPSSPEPGPPRLVACWMSLKVTAAEVVSPESI